MKWHKLLVYGVILAIVVAGMPAHAQKYRDGRRASNDTELDAAVSRARAKTGGRVLSAETRELNGRRTYVIRVLTDDGRVRRLQMDAGKDDSGQGASRRR
ncbi:MAG: PepSY domain-containing protein [Gammaproteobacteria bacterium]|nr:PepSY domain-containing protein [Gammaproteobacteria bacterium]